MKVAMPESLHVLQLESRIAENTTNASNSFEIHKTLKDIELVSKGRKDEAEILRKEMHLKFEAIGAVTEENKSKLDEILNLLHGGKKGVVTGVNSKALPPL